MKPTEAAALLTIAAAFDNRKPDADQAKAWALALDGLRFEDCREVIVSHYQRSREWLMPVDIVTGVRKMRTERLIAFGPIPAPDHLDSDSESFDQDYATYMQAMTRAICDGELTGPPKPPKLPRRDLSELPGFKKFGRDPALRRRPEDGAA